MSVIVVAGRWSMLQLFKYNRFFSMFLFLPLPLPCLNILFWGGQGGFLQVCCLACQGAVSIMSDKNRWQIIKNGFLVLMLRSGWFSFAFCVGESGYSRRVNVLVV